MKQFSLMSSTVCVVFCLFVTVLPLGNLASAHSGDTNQYGCHVGSKPYHCHRS